MPIRDKRSRPSAVAALIVAGISMLVTVASATSPQPVAWSYPALQGLCLLEAGAALSNRPCSTHKEREMGLHRGDCAPGARGLGRRLGGGALEESMERMPCQTPCNAATKANTLTRQDRLPVQPIGAA